MDYGWYANDGSDNQQRILWCITVVFRAYYRFAALFALTIRWSFDLSVHGLLLQSARRNRNDNLN